MSDMKVKLPEIQLTSDETNYLVSSLRNDRANLNEDLSGADCVDISETAIRLLNEDYNIVDSLLKKLEEGL